MNPFTNLVDTIRERLEAHPFCNTVVYGDIFDVDLDKQTLFPVTFFAITNMSYNGPVWTATVAMTSMGLYSDREEYVLAEQLTVGNDVFETLRRGSLHTDKYQLPEGSIPSCVPFKTRLENDCVGWDVTFDVQVPNEFTQS